MIVDGVKVNFSEVYSDEAEDLARQFIREIRASGKEPDRVLLNPDGDEIELKAILKADPGTIRRTRRVTGYLTDLQNMNDAKQAEVRERRAHDEK